MEIRALLLLRKNFPIDSKCACAVAALTFFVHFILSLKFMIRPLQFLLDVLVKTSSFL